MAPPNRRCELSSGATRKVQGGGGDRCPRGTRPNGGARVAEAASRARDTRGTYTVRRGSLLLMLIVLLLTCGGACLFMSDRIFGPGRIDAQMPQFCALAMFLLAGIAGLLGVSSFRRRSRLWARQIEEVASNRDRKASTVITAPMKELVPAAAAISDVIAECDRSVEDMHLRLKEMEIQLKVADAARQHAEAILYSISDAVLVTDVFDELVLANESAARTFEFDLSRAQSARSPVDKVLSDPKMIELIREMRQSSSHKGRRIVEHAVKAPTGENKTFKVTLSCVAGQHDEPAGV